jgi:segregation and condensation protein A
VDDYSVHLPEFEGPLDLLLQMIERAELDITRVSLASIADQYLEFVSKPGNIELTALADFLVIAARLILIKSRMLLPQSEQEAEIESEDSAEALARQLREYRLFKQLARRLREREQKGWHTWPRRGRAPRPVVTRPARINGLTFNALYNALRRTIQSAPALPAGTVLEPLRVSIHQRIAQIRDLTAAQPRVQFSALLEQAGSRIEILVTFLAVLESLKRKLIFVEQDGMFGEIYLTQRLEAASHVPTLDELESDFT